MCRRPSRPLLITIGVASAGTLDRIKQDKAIRIAYREDAPPFSSKDKLGEPAGFMVDSAGRSPRNWPSNSIYPR